MGPGHELQTVSVGHQAYGGKVRCHVLLNRFRGSPGTFCASGHRGLSHKESSSVHRHVLHTDPCNADLPQYQLQHISDSKRPWLTFWLKPSFLWDKTKSERCNRVTPNQAAEILVVILLHWEWLSEKFLLTVLVLITWISTIQQGVWWNPFASSVSFLWFPVARHTFTSAQFRYWENPPTKP